MVAHYQKLRNRGEVGDGQQAINDITNLFLEQLKQWSLILIKIEDLI